MQSSHRRTSRVRVVQTSSSRWRRSSENVCTADPRLYIYRERFIAASTGSKGRTHFLRLKKKIRIFSNRFDHVQIYYKPTSSCRRINSKRAAGVKHYFYDVYYTNKHNITDGIID